MIAHANTLATALGTLPPAASLLDNRTLVAPLITWLIVQVWKFVSRLVFEHKFEVGALWAPGGMPSSHSALVTALATSIALNAGLNSTEFAIAVVLAMVVMYDAAGIRQAAGKHARVINRIVDELLSGYPVTEERLRELLGHTPFQVAVGALLGVFGGWLFNLK